MRKKEKDLCPVAAQCWAIWQYNNDIVFNKNIYFTFYEGIVNRKLLAEVVAPQIVAKRGIHAKHLEVEVIFSKKKQKIVMTNY